MPPHRVGFLRRLGVKTGIHFAHFGLESGMVLEGFTGLEGLYERLYRFNSRRVREKENVKNMRIRNGLKNFEIVCALIYVMITKVLPKGQGARFSKVPVTFRFRNQIFKSKYKE